MKNSRNTEKTTEKKTSKRTYRLEARVTKEEYDKAVEIAKACGLSLSDYIRRIATGHKPRRRLSDKEAEALSSFPTQGATFCASSQPSGTFRLTAERYTSAIPSLWRNG